ncbi:secretion protein F [Sinanaerobacter chloroacetimidivorans]|uniref:Secretion protein F n=1 Tax=Sinanaerobacter chloroacetimidivorans TaxID=2818044 RepID=A0A8J7VZC1_9FIRM|nr:secretion protein F [Sinanaerobacter chloroacetimidivorans]MBR0596403.1 secretion protein F [Sinanaerobacter chloroacetimidivorans]
MSGLLFLFGLFLALGLFFLTASLLKLPTIGAAKAMLGTVKQDKKVAKTIETYLMTVSVRIAKHIRMDEYKRSRISNILKASGMNLTPEVYQAYAFVKSGAILLGVIPCVLLLPLLSPVVVILAVLTYFKESQKADERLKAKRDEIEGELPRLVATIEQELKSSRNVIGMLERFKENAGSALTGELDVLLADMRSSNYEAALTRFEARLNSPMLSDVVRGLIGVLRGDDSAVYFQMLAHDFKHLELQRLKAKAQKIPPKIRVFSFAMLMSFLITYLAIICYVAVTSLGGMF